MRKLGKHNQTARYNEPYWWNTEHEFSCPRIEANGCVLQVELSAMFAHAFTNSHNSYIKYDPASVEIQISL